VLLDDGQRKYIAKFSASNDLFSVVKAEFIAMRLAHKAALNEASVALRTSMGKDVLVIKRFDRVTQMIMRVTRLRFGTEFSCP